MTEVATMTNKNKKRDIPMRLICIEPISNIEKKKMDGIEKRFRYSERCMETNDRFNTMAILAIRIRKNMFYVQTCYTVDTVRNFSNYEYDKLRRDIYHKFCYYSQEELQPKMKINREVSPIKI